MILLFCLDRVTRELNNKELWRFWRHASRGAAICIHSIFGKHKTKIHFDMFNIVRFLWHLRIMQMGQSLEAFLQWKSLVSLLFGCSEAVSIDLFPCIPLAYQLLYLWDCSLPFWVLFTWMPLRFWVEKENCSSPEFFLLLQFNLYSTVSLLSIFFQKCIPSNSFLYKFLVSYFHIEIRLNKKNYSCSYRLRIFCFSSQPFINSTSYILIRRRVTPELGIE